MGARLQCRRDFLEYRMTPKAAILAVALALGPAGAAVAAPGGPDLQENVDGAIDAGVDALLKSVEGPAGWLPDPKFGTGYAALAVYALVKSDVSYLHPVVQKGIQALEGYTFEKVYSVSLYLMAYDAMIEQIDADAKLGESRSTGDRAKFLDHMKTAADWLVAARLKGMGAWNYEALPAGQNPKTHRYDHSNTQFAVLALGVAAERKLQVDPKVWQEIADHFIAVQEQEGEEVQVRPIFRTQPGEGKEGGKRSRLPQGQGKGQPPAQGKTVARKAGSSGSEGEGVKVRARGWKYLSDEQALAGIQGRRRQFSMVCAGISSLLLAQRNLPPASHSDALKAALRDGFGWLSRYLDGNRRPGRDFYAFYSL